MTSLRGLWQQPRLRPPGTSGDLSGRWEKAGWGNSDAVERWTSPCLGRYLPRHLCPFTPAAGHQRSRCCSRPGRTEENSEVHRACCYTPLRTSGHRVHGSFWTPGTCLLPRAWPSHQGGNRDPLSFHYLHQRIAVAIQQGNAAAVLGTSPPGDTDPIFIR